MDTLSKLLGIACLIATSTVSAQSALTYGPTTDLGLSLQTDTSFIDGVYNETTHRFAKSFVADGIKFSRVSTVNNFTLTSTSGLLVTNIDVNYTEAVPFSICYKVANQTSTLWSDLNNANAPFDSGTAIFSSVSGNTSISFGSRVDNVTTYQSNPLGWVFYNVGGTSTYLAFAEVGIDSGIDYNDVVLLFETGSVVPEPATYAMLLGACTLIFVVYRKVTKKSI